MHPLGNFIAELFVFLTDLFEHRSNLPLCFPLIELVHQIHLARGVDFWLIRCPRTGRGVGQWFDVIHGPVGSVGCCFYPCRAGGCKGASLLRGGVGNDLSEKEPTIASKFFGFFLPHVLGAETGADFCVNAFGSHGSSVNEWKLHLGPLPDQMGGHGDFPGVVQSNFQPPTSASIIGEATAHCRACHPDLSALASIFWPEPRNRAQGVVVGEDHLIPSTVGPILGDYTGCTVGIVGAEKASICGKNTVGGQDVDTVFNGLRINMNSAFLQAWVQTIVGDDVE